MNIKKISCYGGRLEFTENYTMSRDRRIETIETTLVRIESDSGLVGWGEACTLGGNYIEGFAGSVRATVSQLGPHLIGVPVLHDAVANDVMDKTLRGQLPGKSAVEMALWDLRGQLLDQPLYSLLGGRFQSSSPVFFPLTMDEPQDMARHASRRFDTEGYRCWQLKCGGSPTENARRVEAVVEAVAGSADFITADVNGGWSVARAREYLTQLNTDCHIVPYLEQPCASLRELAEVRQHAEVPIVADESICTVEDLWECRNLGAADAMNLKSTRVGGLSKARQLRDLAQSFGMMLIFDEPMGSILSATAVAHLAAGCRPELTLAVSHLAVFSTPDFLTKGGARFEGGRVVVTEDPGLGVAVDEGSLEDPLSVAA